MNRHIHLLQAQPVEIFSTYTIAYVMTYVQCHDLIPWPYVIACAMAYVITLCYILSRPMSWPYDMALCHDPVMALCHGSMSRPYDMD